MRFSILPTPADAEPLIEQVQAAHQAELDAIMRYCLLTNYLAAAQIYLQDNFLLKERLKPEHIKDSLLGRWGTSPGINLIYAHLNCLIQHHDISLFLIAGAGHGTPAMLANLYLERSLQSFYPELTLDANGLENLIRGFSCPCGVLDNSAAGTPGTIHPGEELGYALAVAFGAVMDHPDLIVACVISDGEATTGATATAWDSYRLIDPAKSGTVLPIVYLNSDETSTPASYSAMSDLELQQRFTGYGYQVRIVGSQQNHADQDAATRSARTLDADLYDSLDWAYRELCSIQQAARLGQSIAQPKFPLLIVRSPKNWTGIQAIDGASIEVSHRSHLMPAKDVKTNPQQLQLLEDWLRSYEIEALFDQQACPIRELLKLCPQGEQRMGCNTYTSASVYKSFNAPNSFDFEIPIQTKPCSDVEEHSNTEPIGKYIIKVIEQNPQTFRLFCPDELESSNLSAVLEAQCHDDGSIQSDTLQVGLRRERMLEFCSQYTCQGWLQGYLLTGRHGLFLSHETALDSLISLINQHARFLKRSKTFPWRSPVASLNYLAISTSQQEYSGFSQQSSSYINAVLTQKAEIVRVYLPPDANCLTAMLTHCLNTTNQINLILTSPDPMPQWLTMADAIAHCRAGASIWRWASTDQGVEPDVVLVGIGDRATREVMAAAQILRDEIPELRVRVVNVTDLRVLEEDAEKPQSLDQEMFAALFTCDRPAIINFQGNLAVLKQLFFGRPKPDRFQLNGNQGEVIPSLAQNVSHGTSRFHLIIQALRLSAPHNPLVAARASERVPYYEHVLAEQYRPSQKPEGDRASPS